MWRAPFSAPGTFARLQREVARLEEIVRMKARLRELEAQVAEPVIESAATIMTPEARDDMDGLRAQVVALGDRKSTRLNSSHT